jgi:hypothetical protein
MPFTLLEEIDILEHWLLFNFIDGIAKMMVIFSFIDSCVDKNEINWENCVGHCAIGVQSLLLGAKLRISATCKRECLIYCLNASFASTGIHKILQSIFENVITTVNYIKSDALKVRTFPAVSLEG